MAEEIPAQICKVQFSRAETQAHILAAKVGLDIVFAETCESLGACPMWRGTSLVPIFRPPKSQSVRL